MKLCFSKTPFVCTYESMKIECFLDGHIRTFEYFGGVPRRIAYDNLKTAVINVLKKGKHKLNKRFRELRSWYLFDTRFCNVARGNEKGDVENLAKRSERQFYSPIPHVCDIEELNEKHLLHIQTRQWAICSKKKSIIFMNLLQRDLKHAEGYRS